MFGKRKNGVQAGEEATKPKRAAAKPGSPDFSEEATPVQKKPKQIIPLEEEAAQAREAVREVAPESLATEEDMLRVLAEQTGMPYVRLTEYDITGELLSIIPADVARMYRVLPIQLEDNIVTVAMVDPLNIRTLDDLELLVGHPVRGAIANENDILDAIDEYYGDQEADIDQIIDELATESVEFNFEDEDDFGNLEKIASQAPIIRLVNLILLQAIRDRASDLHIEPFQKTFRIRYRVDGTLHETLPPPKHLQLPVVARFKIMADMNIAERRLPQDGRIKLSMGEREIDLRVSTLPTINGESIVMRILDKSLMMLGLEQIGMLPNTLSDFKRVITKPNGIVLVTGPTGSGKTTTLYAALREVFSPMVKMITVEEPVEYQLEGIVQVNVNPKVDLTFAKCLRAILRQDPDTIMIGEIRDIETASISMEAALTGHLVFSTLHTNDAPGAVTRLIDMEVEPFLVTSTVESVLAQRLVRTICSVCSEVYDPPEEMLYSMGVDPAAVQNVEFRRGHGCPDCNFIGYKGRIGIFEHLLMTSEIRELVLARAPTSDIRRKAREEGMRTLREDGWEKVIQGVTTIDEIIRETL